MKMSPGCGSGNLATIACMAPTSEPRWTPTPRDWITIFPAQSNSAQEKSKPSENVGEYAVSTVVWIISSVVENR